MDAYTRVERTGRAVVGYTEAHLMRADIVSKQDPRCRKYESISSIGAAAAVSNTFGPVHTMQLCWPGREFIQLSPVGAQDAALLSNSIRPANERSSGTLPFHRSQHVMDPPTRLQLLQRAATEIPRPLFREGRMQLEES